MSDSTSDPPKLAWAELPSHELTIDDQPIGPDHLDLASTLDCGQAFRWRVDPEGYWSGVVRGRVFRLGRSSERLLYQVYPRNPAEDETVLRRYLRLGVALPDLARDLAPLDPMIRQALAAYPGLRVLGQEPTETLISYLCSTANSVLRISRSLAVLSRLAGRPIAEIDDSLYSAFPSLEALIELPDEKYREGGFGWRGGPIKVVAARLLDQESGWLERMSEIPYLEARARLAELPGVGPKIADCVLLFSLGHDQSVPVDTHVWALAGELFPEELGSLKERRSITARAYERVSLLYRERYGEMAGWAQQYLYHWRRQGYPNRERAEPESRE